MATATRGARQTSQTADKRRLYGLVLLVAAALAIVLPLPYKALQNIGTQDGDHLSLAGYESRPTLLRLPTPGLHKGDRLLDVIIDAHAAAALNHLAALRLVVALVAGVPGAFLVGRYPKTSE
jgi:hypothetical protein